MFTVHGFPLKQNGGFQSPDRWCKLFRKDNNCPYLEVKWRKGGKSYYFSPKQAKEKVFVKAGRINKKMVMIAKQH